MESKSLDYYENNVNQLDVAILAQIATFTAMGAQTNKSKKKEQKEREVTRSHFQLKGKRVCANMYFFAMAISRNKYRRLKNVHLDDGMIPRLHGNVKNVPKHAMNPEQTREIVSFLKRYAELNAIYLTGRYPNQKNFNVKLLPSSDNKAVMYRKYLDACNAAQKPAAGLSTFKSTWIAFCSDITTMKPKNDLCETCQRNYTSHAKINSQLQTMLLRLS